MKFKSYFTNAIKTSLLLVVFVLLFRSLTWNSITDSDLTCKKESEVKQASYSRRDEIFFQKEHPGIKGIYATTRYGSRKLDKTVRSSGILIPSFKEWKEMEMAKYENFLSKDRILNPNRKFTRRKLNYASSKCGAKILASNPEARHRMAVLSDKSDEYFLNPCRVKTWFVIELCDAVEATQVELANYELYSSSPREFSIFWSDIYPTFQWHNLGTFVAKDERTMQTFGVKEKNLGKFIKVIIHNHHGKEHYCPLSVIRVLGFSMDPKLGDGEDEENNVDVGFKDEAQMNYLKTFPSKKESSLQKSSRNKSINLSKMKPTSDTKDVCFKFFKHCSNVSDIIDHKICLNKPTCQFLHEILKNSNINCLELYSPKYPDLFSKVFKYISKVKLKTDSSFLTMQKPSKFEEKFEHRNEKDIIKDYEHKKYLRIQKECEIYASAKLKEKHIESNRQMIDHCTAENIQKIKNAEVQKNRVKPNYLYDRIARIFKNKSPIDKDCSEIVTRFEMELTKNGILAQEQRENYDEIDSAGLISKESVLFKLSTKLKTSEIEVSLINKYLQQLSESYRHQIEDMKTKISNTAQAMANASEKSEIVNAKQENSIMVLNGKVEALRRKTDFLMKEKNELIKKVVELHGFFLILEIVIMSAVFNTFLNILKKRYL